MGAPTPQFQYRALQRSESALHVNRTTFQGFALPNLAPTSSADGFTTRAVGFAITQTVPRWPRNSWLIICLVGRNIFSARNYSDRPDTRLPPIGSRPSPDAIALVTIAVQLISVELAPKMQSRRRCGRHLIGLANGTAIGITTDREADLGT